MVCNPSSNSFSLAPTPPGPSIPGLGLPFSVPKTPFSDVTLPKGVPEDIIGLVNSFQALFPQGAKFQVNADSLMKTVNDAISNLFNQMAPYMAFYKMFTVLLDMVMCIINVICALLNPFALISAVQKLFKQCIPNFLSLFPQTAVAVMVLSLILLLIGVIEYIITTLIDYITQIIANIDILVAAFQTSDSDGILAATNKIAYLLCGIEGLFAILIAVQALVAIIQPLLGMTRGSVCSDSDSCCGSDFCPPFIKNNPTFMKYTTGQLLYLNQIQPAIPTDPSFDFLRTTPMPPIRTEQWEFVDTLIQPYKFMDVITPSPNLGVTFWPEGESYQSNANKILVPYLLDMTMTVDPAAFGHVDNKGARKFLISNAIVKNKPTIGVSNYNNNMVPPNTGTLSIGGGLVYEVTSTGNNPYIVNNAQATLDTFIHRNTTFGNLPITDDGTYISNIEYTFKWNQAVLVDKKITSIMCAPELSTEAVVVNAEADNTSAFDKLGPIPDVTAALVNLNNCVNDFRTSINKENAIKLQLCCNEILNKLKAESEVFYCNGVVQVADRYKSDFSTDVTTQFTTLPIKINIVLRDKTTTPLAQNVTQSLGLCIAKAITAEATLGKTSDFIYDGYGVFTSNLTSKIAGLGDLKVFIRKEVFAEVLNRDVTTAPSTIVDRHIGYEFIDSTTPSIHRTNLGGDGGGEDITIGFDISDLVN